MPPLKDSSAKILIGRYYDYKLAIACETLEVVRRSLDFSLMFFINFFPFCLFARFSSMKCFLSVLFCFYVYNSLALHSWILNLVLLFQILSCFLSNQLISLIIHFSLFIICKMNGWTFITATSVGSQLMLYRWRRMLQRENKRQKIFSGEVVYQVWLTWEEFIIEDWSFIWFHLKY